MNFVKISLYATTALGLSIGAAAAGGNDAFLSQNSNDSSPFNNTALIDQSTGSNNQAGSVGKIMTQTSFGLAFSGNELTIIQSGDENAVGLNGVGVSQKGQKGNGNVATVTQRSNNNSVGSIEQATRYGGTYSSGNTLTILQSGVGSHSIGRVIQDRNGGDNGSVATLIMRGENNNITKATQGTDTSGAGNRMRANISGKNNGQGTLSGFAALSGAATSELNQGGRNNTADQGNNRMNLTISGTDNDFGVTQLGWGNRVGTLSITGGSNQLGVMQAGRRNSVTVANIAGVGNNIGVNQTGSFNIASVSATENNNIFGVQQNGVNNNATVDVMGSGNGSTSTTPTLSGDALAASGLSGQFIAGAVRQLGDDNGLTASITGNDNLFGMVQYGSRNSIYATVIGDSNQSVVVQMGNDNSATYAQIGNNNNAGISQ